MPIVFMQNVPSSYYQWINCKIFQYTEMPEKIAFWNVWDFSALEHSFQLSSVYTDVTEVCI